MNWKEFFMDVAAILALVSRLSALLPPLISGVQKLVTDLKDHEDPAVQQHLTTIQGHIDEAQGK